MCVAAVLPLDPVPVRLVAAPRVTGRVVLPASCDETRLLPHILDDLRARGCEAFLAADGVLVVQGRSERRGSVLGFVSDGLVWLERDRTLRCAFSLRGGLLLCLVLSPIAAGLAWFGLGSAGLAVFGLLAPVLWLYGANHVLAAIRVPAHMARLCRTAPTRRPGPWDRPA